MLSYIVIIYKDYNNLRYICIVHGWIEAQILFTDENFVEIWKGSPHIQPFLYTFLLKREFTQVALTISHSYTFSCSNYSLYR